MLKADVIVIGSGIAGLSFAYKIAKARKDFSVAIITKSEALESNTRFAQGGISVVTDLLNDSFEKHVKDTMDAGRGLSDKHVVETVVKSAPERLKELVDLGVDFDMKSIGHFDLNKEGGHSCHRVVHSKDRTGLEIEQTLLKQIELLENVKIYSNLYAIDLICQKNVAVLTGLNVVNQCYGVKVMHCDNSVEELFYSRVTLLATGGCGQVYLRTTNPDIAFGDGVAMASRSGAEIKDMRFIQFHPTALFSEKFSPLFLISEAVRGYGAFLTNKEGKRFMFKYDLRGELSTRDIVSHAIETELKSSVEPCVYLDCRHLDYTEFQSHFPSITAHCEETGIDIRKDLIPVVPAAHYQCGGIKVDLSSQTSIRGLYASGECASTGLHGANRLASNSLLEAVVFSHLAFMDVLKLKKDELNLQFIPEFNQIEPEEQVETGDIQKLKLELKMLMSTNVGISRTKQSLNRALVQVNKLKRNSDEFLKKYKANKQLFEFRNMVLVSLLIIKDALAHYDEDIEKGIYDFKSCEHLKDKI